MEQKLAWYSAVRTSSMPLFEILTLPLTVPDSRRLGSQPKWACNLATMVRHKGTTQGGRTRGLLGAAGRSIGTAYSPAGGKFAKRVGVVRCGIDRRGG